MVEKFSKLIITLLLLCIPAIVSAHEPFDLHQVKLALMHYHDSGDYQKDVNQVIHRALTYLQNKLKQSITHRHKKYAIVLDIDETSLSNYSNMVKLGFGGSDEDIHQAELAANDPAVEPTLQLYQFAKTHHVAVFFITGRSEDERAKTAENLKAVGFSNWDGLILKPTDYHQKSITPFKTSQRKNIVKAGYEIVLNIGDQKSDLRGKYADRAFKLPNPFYYLA